MLLALDVEHERRQLEADKKAAFLNIGMPTLLAKTLTTVQI